MKNFINYSARTALTTSLCSIVLLFSNCKKEEKPVLESNPLKQELSKPELLAADGITSNSYYLVNSLPAGYVKDGSKDYTSYIQAAISRYSNIVFPEFPLQINTTGLIIPSNRTITFLEGSELRMKANSLSHYNVLLIRGASNVTLYNPVVKGDRYSHTGTEGEWGQGLGIYGSSNVTVYNGEFNECWGDGIYIGDNKGIPSSNILIEGGQCLYNRRDGVSITSVKGLDINNLGAAYSTGTSPWCGINIEANSSADELQDITLNNIRTTDNPGAGIQIGLAKIYGGNDKNVNITINNHYDKRSYRGMYVDCSFRKQLNGENVYGSIQVNDPYYRQNSFRPMVVYIEEQNWKFNMHSPALMLADGQSITGQEALNFLKQKYYINPITNYELTN